MENEESIDLGRLMQIMLERKKVVGGIVAGCTALAIGTAFILPKQYESTTLVQTRSAGKDIGAILKKAGMDLVSTVGGSSGPLYGTAFMKAGAKAAGKNEIGMEDFLVMMEEAIGGVQMRGKAVRGEKTMLDAMIPALEAMKAAAGEGKDTKDVLDAGVTAAEEGVEYTKTIIATKGRASYLGERSIGHQDPGATSFTVLLKAIAAGY